MRGIDDEFQQRFERLKARVEAGDVTLADAQQLVKDVENMVRMVEVHDAAADEALSLMWSAYGDAAYEHDKRKEAQARCPSITLRLESFKTASVLGRRWCCWVERPMGYLCYGETAWDAFFAALQHGLVLQRWARGEDDGGDCICNPALRRLRGR
jgi:hypothetical protein